MVTLFRDGPGTYDSSMGEFVSDEHVRLARVISDYKPTMSLEYIPKRDQVVNAFGQTEEKPWRIVERDPRFGVQIIRYLSHEDMTKPAAILAWLFEGDTDKHDRKDILARIEREATAQKLLDYQRELDELEDIADHMQFFMTGGRDHKNYIRHNGETVTR